MSKSLHTLIIGCGGCGANVVEHLKNGMNDESFIEYMTVDTSTANVKKDIPFHHIKKDDTDGKALTGTGGVRGEHLNDLKSGVKKFLDEKQLHKFDGVIYLVFSSSGGSGSIIAPLMLNTLLPYDLPICLLVVHDTTNEQYAKNSKKTLETLHSISTSNQYCLPITYFTNTNTIPVVNESILEEFKNIMYFHDTENITEIDNQDMKNFYNSRKYTQIDIPKGMLSVTTIKPEHAADVLTKHKVIIGRSLTNDETDPLKGGGIRHNKNGKANNKAESVLILLNNFDKQYDLLKRALAVYEEEIPQHKIDIDTTSKDNLVL